MQPRQQLLEIWQATARSSIRDGQWAWGGRNGTNSISDAEQLLCLLSPATAVSSFALGRPNSTDDMVIRALPSLGDQTEIPRRLVGHLTEFMTRYVDDRGTPTFPAAGYLQVDPSWEASASTPTDRQLHMETVESFAVSMTLSLAAIRFVREFRQEVRGEANRRQADELERLASTRLTAAMVGLLRSYSVYAFDADSQSGGILLATANQERLPKRRAVSELREALREVAAMLDEVRAGAGMHLGADLDSPGQLFECGWSWGLVKGATEIDTSLGGGLNKEGYAEAAPYLFFTESALKSIAGLLSARDDRLLNKEQHELARDLYALWNLTQRYWSTLASFGRKRWPLEDMPWQTTDETQSDYYSLLVSAITVQRLATGPALSVQLAHLAEVLDYLGKRSRITLRPLGGDPAVQLHVPGFLVPLVGTEEIGGPRLAWLLADFAPLLLRQVLDLARLTADVPQRDKLLEQADQVWQHLARRRLGAGSARGLWDHPRAVFSDVEDRDPPPSWAQTVRVVECLIAATNLIGADPPQSPLLAGLARDLLHEADHTFARELLGGSGDARSMRHTIEMNRAKLRRARDIVDDRPGAAFVLASQVLSDLEQLAAGRDDVSEAD